MKGLPYYKRYPRDFIDGVVGMSFEERGAYSMILDLIYMRGGQLPCDARYIAGHLGCSVRKWTSLLDALVMHGKLRVVDGIISNFRANYEVEETGKFRDKQAENARQPRKINELPQPKDCHTDTDTDTDKEEPKGSPSQRAKPEPAGWPDFWGDYPRKVAKPEALKAYTRALTRSDPETIRNGLIAQLPSWSANDPKFIPHPATWLNRDGWNDQPTDRSTTNVHRLTPPSSDRDDRIDAMVEGARIALDRRAARSQPSAGSPPLLALAGRGTHGS